MSYQKLLLTAREQAEARLNEKGLGGSRERKFVDAPADEEILMGKPLVSRPERSLEDEGELQDDFMTSYYNKLYKQNQELRSQIEETLTSIPETGVDTDYNPLSITEELYGKKGVQSGEPVSYSYFNTPIIEGELRGNSRKAGDISPENQEKIIGKIIEIGSALDMDDKEIAYALATARYESGFNPDASAKSTSARGLGQFINKTGQAYGLNESNQWDVDMQAQALLEHTQDNFNMARNKNLGDEYVYAIHHDGPSLNRNGLSKSKQYIMPYVPKYLKMIQSYRGQ